ncbi:hypothetical protein ACWATR_06605 [Nostoc sp. UIC 10890]
MSTTGYAYAIGECSAIAFKLSYRTEFRSQESEWAKRPATANSNVFCMTDGASQR